MEPKSSYLKFPTTFSNVTDEGVVIKRAADFSTSSRIRNVMRYKISYDVKRPYKKTKTPEVYSILFVTDNKLTANNLYCVRPAETDALLVKKMHYRGIMAHYYDTVYVEDFNREAINTLAFIYSLN